jgi:hypothetical protein
MKIEIERYFLIFFIINFFYDLRSELVELIFLLPKTRILFHNKEPKVNACNHFFIFLSFVTSSIKLHFQVPDL